MIDLYAGVCKEPVARVLNTHANGDHCWGNQLFPQAELIGHRLCAEHFTRENPAVMQSLRGAANSSDPAMAHLGKALSDWDFSGIELTPPTTLIDERLDLELGPVRVQMLYVGPAHTSADVIAFLPDQRILFTGDVLFQQCTPIGWDGTYDKWISALDAIIALRPEIVVPGHGPLCGIDGPRDMKNYLRYVRSEARRFYDREIPALEAAKSIDLGPYAGWTEPERLIFNVERAYREFRGEAHDAPIDVGHMFRQVHELRQAMRARAC
jgi:cyclase